MNTRAYYHPSDLPPVMSADGLEIQRARSQPGTESQYPGNSVMSPVYPYGPYEHLYGDVRAEYVQQYGYYPVSPMVGGGNQYNAAARPSAARPSAVRPSAARPLYGSSDQQLLQRELDAAHSRIRKLESRLEKHHSPAHVGRPSPLFEDPNTVASLAQLGIPELSAIASDHSQKPIPSLGADHADLYRHSSNGGTPVMEYHKLLEQKQKMILEVGFVEKALNERRAAFAQKMEQMTQLSLSAKQLRQGMAEQNWLLETQIIELGDDLANLREQLEREKHQNYLQTVGEDEEGNFNFEGSPPRFPPENVIIQNLIRAQVEFYFSDYNLKRDKRLLDQICSDRFGYLRVDTVMNLARVRQLSSHRGHVIAALQKSKFLALTSDDWVGRPNFQRPLEKQFPFRRTVYVFGLKSNDDEYVRQMLEPFGSIAKVQFDHGPDTLDRKIAQQMFESARVYKLVDFDNPQVAFTYQKNVMVGGSKEYQCQWCSKTKSCGEGFYEGGGYMIFVCLQCAAAQAERQAERFRQEEMLSTEINRPDVAKNIALIYLGQRPANYKNTITALAVFTSQRQASKCVYVRSRIAYEGCFTTHYHHYSKMKKEIAMNMKIKCRVIGPTGDKPTVGRSLSLPLHRSPERISPVAVNEHEMPPHPQLQTSKSHQTRVDRSYRPDDRRMVDALLNNLKPMPRELVKDSAVPPAIVSSPGDGPPSVASSESQSLVIGDILDVKDSRVSAVEFEATKRDDSVPVDDDAGAVEIVHEVKVDEDTKKQPGFHRMMTAPVSSASHTYLQSKNEQSTKASGNDDGTRWNRENWGKQRDSLNVAKKTARQAQHK